MRTKTLLCAALLAASAATTMAQSNVYSLNVVGYIQVPTYGGGNFNMVANPLNNTNNGIANLFANAQDGDQVYRWNAGIQDLDGTIYTYSTFSHSWDGNFTLQPGEGVFYANAGNNTNITFVGDVIQGAYTQPVGIVGSGSFNLVSSSVPLGYIPGSGTFQNFVGASFTNAVVGVNPQDGDQIYKWDPSIQDLYGQIATYSTFSHSWDDTTLIVNNGEGFFYAGAGTNQVTWSRNYTVQ